MNFWVRRTHAEFTSSIAAVHSQTCVNDSEPRWKWSLYFAIRRHGGQLVTYVDDTGVPRQRGWEHSQGDERLAVGDDDLDRHGVFPELWPVRGSGQ